jgi:diguanylate cyclase (GGDEF)-like protein
MGIEVNMKYKLVEFDKLLQEIQLKEPLENNLEKIVSDMEKEISFQSAGIFLKLPGFINYELVCARNLSETFQKSFSLEADAEIIRQLLEKDSLLLTDSHFFKTENTFSEMYVSSLHYKKKLFGLFFINKKEGSFLQEELTKIEMFVSIISMQILIYMQQYEIEKLKKFDEVTGVYTNFSFLEQGDFLLTQMNRYHRHLTLILVRISSYEAIKNQRSQQLFDVLRRKIATALRSDLRESDLIGMIDEPTFAILMPETSVSIIYQAILRLNEIIGQIPELNGANINWGISGKDEQTATIEDLLQYATNALQESESKENDNITFY